MLVVKKFRTFWEAQRVDWRENWHSSLTWRNTPFEDLCLIPWGNCPLNASLPCWDTAFLISTWSHVALHSKTGPFIISSRQMTKFFNKSSVSYVEYTLLVASASKPHPTLRVCWINFISNSQQNELLLQFRLVFLNFLDATEKWLQFKAFKI